jgi:hypothetical protein
LNLTFVCFSMAALFPKGISSNPSLTLETISNTSSLDVAEFERLAKLIGLAQVRRILQRLEAAGKRKMKVNRPKLCTISIHP